MLRKFAPLLGAAAACALLSSCFGGGSSTPTPTLTVFDFTKAFTDTVANASYIYAYFTPTTGGGETWSDGSRVGGSSKITYAISPDSAAFTFPDAASLMTFGAADLQTATPTLRAYRNGTEALTLELPFQHVLRASYERKQSFTLNTVPGTLRSTRVTLFFNEVSTANAITANLSYTGTAQVAGGKPGTAVQAFTSPASTFTVTASDKKITGSIQIIEMVGGVATVRAVLPISATLAADGSFTGAIDDTANGFKGTFVGALAGPSREEVFLIFNVAHTDGREFIGSYIGT